jgi:hypothetical protein
MLIDPVNTQQELAAVEEYIQRTGCPDHTKYAKLYLKNGLQKLSNTQNNPSISTQDEILKGLSAIEKHLSAPSNLLLKAPLYTNQACIAAPQGAHKKPVSDRALNEVVVKVIKDAKESQTSEKYIESVNAVRLSKAGKVQAEQKLSSRDV